MRPVPLTGYSIKRLPGALQRAENERETARIAHNTRLCLTGMENVSRSLCIYMCMYSHIRSSSNVRAEREGEKERRTYAWGQRLSRALASAAARYENFRCELRNVTMRDDVVVVVVASSIRHVVRRRFRRNVEEAQRRYLLPRGGGY